MRIARQALAFALAAGLISGCTSYNPLVAVGLMSEPAHKPTPLQPINALLQPKAIWRVNVGKSAPFTFKPDAEGGRIYAASSDGVITVLDEENGRVVTRAET